MVRKGFTLIELMVVLAIIAILATIMLPQIMHMVERARIAKAQAEVKNTSTAMFSLLADTGRTPGERDGGWMGDATTSAALNDCRYGLLCNNGYPANTWQGPYLQKAVALDPWGRNYYYDGHPTEWRCPVGQPGHPGACASFLCRGPDGNRVCWNRADLICGINTGDADTGRDDIIVYLHR